MVAAAAAADGVLLERAQAGRRLARVEDRRAGAVDELDESRGERGDAAEPRDERQLGGAAAMEGAAFDDRARHARPATPA